MSLALAPDVLKLCEPPPSLSVAQWADAERLLPESSAARGARYRTAFVEYLREVMDSTIVPGVTRIVVQKAHQTGASEALYNVLAYHMVHRPSPMLLVMPTVEAGQAVAKERIGDLIRTTPAVRAVVYAKRSAGPLAAPESTLNLLLFRGGFLAVGGSNSPNTFARAAVRLAIGDDADRWPATVGEEGDPADLLANRTTSFHDGRTVFVSTPTLQGARVDALYQQSDMRRFVLACPACGREDWCTWSDPAHWSIVYTERTPATAHLACPCGHRVYEPARLPLVRGGYWQPTVSSAPAGHRGYHVPAMLSPFITLPNLVERWLDAQQRGREALRTFVNTSLAEPWIEDDTTIRIATSEEALMAQREPYETVPNAASWVTAGLDVQENRLELLCCAWGPREEMWVLSHDILTREDGFDPYDSTTWDKLYTSLFGPQAVTFEHVSGVKLRLQTLVVDSGFQTAQVYRFSRFDRGRILASKGVAEIADGHLIKYSEDRDSPSRLRAPLRLVLINTSVAKQRLADRLQDGRIHFPIADWCTEEFFRQMNSEILQPVFNTAGVRTGGKWIKQRPRNEILDLLVMNLAAKAINGTRDLNTFRQQVGLPSA